MGNLLGLRSDTRVANVRNIARAAAGSILLLLLAGNACFGVWSDLPGNMHAVMPILHNEADDSSAATVLLMASCESSFQSLYRSSRWSDDEVGSYWERVQSICNQKWGSACRALYVMVVPTIGHEGEATWWPWNLTISQDRRSYSPSFNDSIVGLSRDFQGRVYSIMDGLIRLPEEIDVSRPFQISYWLTEATIGPFNI
jgi:hypothetical protein